MDKKLYAEYCRKIAAEGCVLLENDGTLPLKKTDKTAVFGREQFEYVKSGSGSGGRVNCPYVTNLYDYIKDKTVLDDEVTAFYKGYIAENPLDEGDGMQWELPSVQKQPVLDEEFVKAASARNDKAVMVISRIAGEAIDMKVERGYFFLTEQEELALELITRYFSRVVVVLNVGNLIDVTPFKKYNVNALLLCWQGGQEGGAALADALSGETSPSGKLPVTVASLDSYKHIPFGNFSRNIHFEDIFVGYRYFVTFAPDKIIYPFGFGLSYTNFKMQTLSFSVKNGRAKVAVKVENVGDHKGREVVEIYFSAPQGKLGKAAKELIAYKKTAELLPGASETVEISFDINELAAFDDKNACGFGHAFVLEKGEYCFFIGGDSLHNEKIGSYLLDADLLVKKASDALHPRQSFTRLTAFGTEKVVGYEDEIPASVAREIEYTGERGLTLKNVADGVCTMDEFIAQFTAEQLSWLLKGEGWGSRKTHVIGSAAIIGGTTEVFAAHGVPIVALCDGPAGPTMFDLNRLEECKNFDFTCIPTGTLLASTWDEQGIERIFTGFAEEMKDVGIDVILGPGVNIHRHPLGGRNFEYFSEDPRLAGNFAAAIGSYFNDNGVICTLKHFAVNSQESGRSEENEVLSERALREIYLKVFEIAVNTGKINAIMSSYNRINGISASGNIGLIDTILRGEWGYDGFVMSDWGTKADKFSNGSFGSFNIAEMVAVQNDAYMCCEDVVNNNDDLVSEYEAGNLSLASIQRSARRVLECIMKTQTFKSIKS